MGLGGIFQGEAALKFNRSNVTCHYTHSHMWLSWSRRDAQGLRASLSHFVREFRSTQ
jgi:hypothetical protein